MRRKMTFADLSAHVQEVFASMCKDGVTPEENYEGFKKLTYDLNNNPNEMFDEDGNKITKREAESAVRKVVYAIIYPILFQLVSQFMPFFNCTFYI